MFLTVWDSVGDSVRDSVSQSPLNRVNVSYGTGLTSVEELTESQSPLNRVNVSYWKLFIQQAVRQRWSQSPLNRVNVSYKYIGKLRMGKLIVAIPFKSGQCFLLNGR